VHSVLAQTQQGMLQQQLQAQMQAQMQTVMQMQAHGPFPPPAAIKEYELILPGTFDRIFKMAEKAQIDQVDTVRFAQQAQRQDTARVHWMALIISLAAVAGAVFCAWLHETVVATACLGVPVFAVAKAFIDSLRAPTAAQQAQLQQQAQQQQAEQMQKMLQQLATKGQGGGGPPA
jgi:uncharacterized membrane protein